MTDETTKQYVVTKGNYVTDADGKKCFEGDKMKLTPAQAKALLAVKVIENV